LLVIGLPTDVRARVRYLLIPGGFTAAHSTGKDPIAIGGHHCPADVRRTKAPTANAEIAETFHVSRKTIYRHLAPTSTPPTSTGVITASGGR
jgi:hypothetical protein